MSQKHFHLTCSLLLTMLIAGCGSDDSSDTSDQQPAAPTLAGSFEGKRVHFQIGPDEEGARTETFWLQMGDANQLTVNDNGRNITMPYVINDTKLIVEAGGEAVEIRFTKAELAVDDQVTFFEHNLKDVSLQALLESADDSAAKRTSPGTILKIEPAQEIVAESAPERPDPPVSVEDAGAPEDILDAGPEDQNP